MIEAVEPDARLTWPPGTTAVCIPVYCARALFEECLMSIVAHTAPSIPILIADDFSPADERIPELVREIAGRPEAVHHRIISLRQPVNVGFVANVNTAFRVLNRADVVIVNSDVRVAAGWLDRMTAAARSDVRTATVSTLTNHGSILSVPERNTPMPAFPPGCDFDDAATKIAERSLRLYPRIPVAIGHCVLICRSALDLVGEFDELFSPGYGEEVDFSLRAGARGLLHLVADDVLVFHRGRASFSDDGEKSPTQIAHDEIICERYPFYEEWIGNVASEERSPLERALLIAKTCIVQPSVLIDARCLSGAMTGTQIHALELIHALHETNSVDLRVLAPHHVNPDAAAILQSIGGITLVREGEIDDAERVDVVHRPYQLGHGSELLDLMRLGRRVVITHQDLIAYNAPEYFPNYAGFVAYRRVTRDVFGIADFVVFFSAHALNEAQAAGLTNGDRTAVVHLGTDHAFFDNTRHEDPAPVEAVGESPFLLCLGTDFRHKNREFALEVARRLRRDYRWDGLLVFAGPHVADGSSRPDEAARIRASQDLGDAVIDLGAVSEGEKAWLIEQAAVVLYPTTIEGFGLVPFEAAAAGTPCVFAPMGSLGELFAEDDALLTAWDADATAATVLALMTDPSRAAANVANLREAGARLSWKTTAAGLLDVYLATIRNPGPSFATTTAVQEEYIIALRDLLTAYGVLDEDGNTIPAPLGMALANPATGVPDDVKRLILTISRRPWLKRPVFGLMSAPYRVRRLKSPDRSE